MDATHITQAIQFYEFGPYRFDLSKRVVTRAGETISLTPKATEILMLLVTNAGQLLEKDELLKEVWPDTFVEESNLTQNIFTLRRALGDERTGPRYIETVARRGYRFVATVRAISTESEPEENGTLEPSSMDASFTERPILAVLPFVDTTGNQGLAYLAEGVTDNIINSLSRVSKLRVMSRSAVFRYRSIEVNPQQVGRDIGATAVLVGTISSRASGVVIGVELVEAGTGWLLWGESFDVKNSDILQIQDAITRQLLEALKLSLSGEEEKRVTARYTENAAAYQAYLEGRYHWSRYTRTGIEKAIGHFRRAIELDSNYALAYSSIVDCYLRLATNYLPPEDDVATISGSTPVDTSTPVDGAPTGGDGPIDPKIRLRFEWDWKGAERELRRANELNTNYPSVHQWYAAYLYSIEVLKGSLRKGTCDNVAGDLQHTSLPQLFTRKLTPNEEVQIFCTIAREQIEVGNYEAGCLMLQRWWLPGEWPKLDDLSSRAAADLLFTTGSLAGCLSSTGSMRRGQKHAETLLSGSFSMFEHLGARRMAAEARIELALSYYRQGMFEVTRRTLSSVLAELQPGDNDLKSFGLIRLAVVERHAGQIKNSLSSLAIALDLLEQNGPLITGRYHHELASSLKELALAEDEAKHTDSASFHYERAFFEFCAIGHHRYAAVVKNNHGLLLLNLSRFEDAEVHLFNARVLFEAFHDTIRCAQVDDTIARLYLATDRFDLARVAAERAVISLETSDEEALLAEALVTKGTVLFKLNRHQEAQRVLQGAWRIAERAGDYEGAGRALLLILEEMWDRLEPDEQLQMGTRLRVLLADTQQATIATRVQRCLKRVVR